jgi:hypothetical protein
MNPWWLLMLALLYPASVLRFEPSTCKKQIGKLQSTSVGAATQLECIAGRSKLKGLCNNTVHHLHVACLHLAQRHQPSSNPVHIRAAFLGCTAAHKTYHQHLYNACWNLA